MSADDLELLKELGRGAYGVVEMMRHRPSDTIMAVKVRENSAVLFYCEVVMMLSCFRDHVIILCFYVIGFVFSLS